MPRLNRRAMLKTLAVAGAAATCRPTLLGQADVPRWIDPTLRYLESLAREDGGYAWEDQEQSHLTPTFAVIGCHRALGRTPPRAAALAEFVRAHHPAKLKKLEQERRSFEFQQIQALAWLDAQPDAGLRDKILAWIRPIPYLKQYEQHGHPIFQSEAGVFVCRRLMGLPLNELTPEFMAYLDDRRRPNGSFNNTPAAEGGDGHVMNSWWGLRALDALGRMAERRQETIDWLRSCQVDNGGFTFAPKPEFGGVDDVAYTWAAARALKLLGSKPARRDACISYLHSLAHEQGGFSDRAGWMRNPVATYYAVDAFAALDALSAAPGPAALARPRRKTKIPPGMKVFTIQIEAHGHGSPAEAVHLARSLRIDLWGAKNARPAWLARARDIAARENVPVTFFVSDEEYGTWVNVPGLGTYSHTSDIIAPAGSDFGDSLARAGTVSWDQFRSRRLASLSQAGGRLIWQFGENEELVRMYLDDSVERGGYAAISTFHFGNPDFTNSEPFLNRWRGQIPYIALQDSHGNEPWWFSDMTTGFRTLFLAKEPTWDAWLNALKENWVAAVRHDAASGNKTWLHTGSSEVLAFVREREQEWRWWDNPRTARPLVSVVAVKPGDEFETARPTEGATIRVRCAWQNTPQGLLKEPITELVELRIDGREVQPKLISAKAPRGALLTDHYHHFHVSSAGPHTAAATVREIATNRKIEATTDFRI